MQCLRKYKWVKLPRNLLPPGKGIMGDWAKLAARAAFRKGNATYCGFTNPVTPGMWAGGICGVKAILGTKSRKRAEEALEQLSALNFIRLERNPETKYLSYQITDWVMECSGAECEDGAVYTTDGYGFLCLPRNITDRLIQKNHIFEEADAWLDLWCHTVSNDSRNAFSFYAPLCQFQRNQALLTLETLGKRWKWEKTKVWRFLQKHSAVFSLLRLPGSLGCLVFNLSYPTGHENAVPQYEEVVRILERIRIYAANTHKHGTAHEHMSRMVAWFSGRLLTDLAAESESDAPNSPVAHLASIYRAYISQCWSCRNSVYDCSKVGYIGAVSKLLTIRGPCGCVDLTKIGKEFFINAIEG